MGDIMSIYPHQPSKRSQLIIRDGLFKSNMWLLRARPGGENRIYQQIPLVQQTMEDKATPRTGTRRSSLFQSLIHTWLELPQLQVLLVGAQAHILIDHQLRGRVLLGCLFHKPKQDLLAINTHTPNLLKVHQPHPPKKYRYRLEGRVLETAMHL